MMASPCQRTVIVLVTFHVVYLYCILLRPGDVRVGQEESVPPNVTRGSIPVPLPQAPSEEKPRSSRRLNAVVTEYDVDIAQRLRSLVERKAKSRDPELISLIRDLIDPPSPHILKIVMLVTETPQSKAVDVLLGQKTKGFYVECGALNGERFSNTLFFEQKRQWEGLLIEMDPYFYTQLRGKSRRAYSINACLSPFDYPLELDFEESTGGAGVLIDPGKPTKGDARDPILAARTYKRKVPCFPLESILVALNRTRVDYFSLDVEGFELDVLKTVPFDSVDVEVLSVDYAHGRSGKQSYRTFMESKGYDVHKDIHHHDPKVALHVDDFIFKKKTP